MFLRRVRADRVNPVLAGKHPTNMRILAISGSLRSHSTNSCVLQSLVLLAPSALEIVLYRELSQIPAFSPDLEQNDDSGPVNRFRQALSESAVVVFSTPEYAHGIPGALKNALDWVVGSGELSQKPVVMINASSRGVYAQAALKEVLTTMDAKLVRDAEVTIDLPKRDMPAKEIAADPELSSALRKSLDTILAIQQS